MKKCTTFLLLINLLLLWLPSAVFAEDLPLLAFDSISVEEQTAVTKNLSLIENYSEEITLTWTCTDPNVITPSGYVNRPMPGQPNATVTLTAHTSDGKSEDFVVTVLAFQNATEVLEKSKNDLLFSSLTDENINCVTKNLSLPRNWYNNTYIHWTSNNENVLQIDNEIGVVRRPAFREGLSCVVLTAHIGYDNQSVTKSFLVRVEEETIGRGYSRKLLEFRDKFDQSFLREQNLSSIYGDLVLPTIADDDIVISYMSHNPEIVTKEGKVTRSFDRDQKALFVINFDYGWESTRLSYAMIVKAINTTEVDDKINADLDWLENMLQNNYDLTRLTESLSLPEVAPNGSTLEYVSSNTNVLSNSGAITRGTVSQAATLTITAKLSEQQASRVVNVTVLPANSFEQNNDGSVPGGTVVGGGSGDMQIQMEIDWNQKKIFNDVPDNHWASEAILGLHAKGIVSGDGSNRFRPDDKLTREELVKMVVLANNIPLQNGTAQFWDVSNTHWSYPYVAAAFANGVINGRDDGSFGLGDMVTRQDASVMIYNVLKRAGYPFVSAEKAAFADAEKIAGYATIAVTTLQSNGFMNGKGDNMFMPLDNLTRAEAAMLIWRIIK